MLHEDSSCTSCVVGSSSGKSESPMIRSHSLVAQTACNNALSSEGPQLFSSPFSLVVEATAAMLGGSGQCSNGLSTSSPAGGHFFHKGLQHSPVFSPALPNQGQNLYNGMFGAQSSFSSQSIFPSSNYGGYSHVDPPLWLSENRGTAYPAEMDRSNRSIYMDKSGAYSSQSPCCGNRIAVAENTGMCSPLSSETCRAVTKELVNFQAKTASSIDSQNWFCNQGAATYIQQNQNPQHSTYKCNEQFSSCSVMQMNLLLQEQSEIKQSAGSGVTNNCYENRQNTVSDTAKPACMNLNKENGTKFCTLQKSEQAAEGMDQEKQASYSSHSSVFSSSSELQEEALYSQASLILHMNSDNSRFQNQYSVSKHHGETVLQHFHEPTKCQVDSGVPCDMMEVCLQSDMKPIGNMHSESNCCQVSARSEERQQMFSNQMQSRQTVNCNIVELNSQLPLEEPGRDNSEESSSAAGESDIIVEETEEDMTESEISIEEIKGTVFREEECPRCLVCSTTQTLEIQFVQMRIDTPVTSASRVPVATKLAQVVSSDHIISLPDDFICRRCLNLVETVDCLETKLRVAKQDLIKLFENRLGLQKDGEVWKPNECNTQSDDKKIVIPANEQCHELNDKIQAEEDKGKATLTDEYKESTKEGKNQENVQNNGQKEKVHNNEVQCTTCGNIFSNREYLKRHREEHHPKQVNFCCDRCGKGFTHCHQLENHLLTHKQEHRFLCEHCGKLFLHLHSLDDHIRAHNNQFRVRCLRCDKGFMCQESLDVHLRTHTGERPFVCQHCGKKFSTSSNLTAHVRTCSGELPFKCDECNKGFSLAAHLRTHIKALHEGQYRFACAICGRGFTKDADRKAHTRTHSREKPHECKTCGKRYSNLGNLNQHKRCHGESPFQCTQCGKGFLRRSCLVGHMNHHVGARPFKCEECGKTFSAQRNLHTHRKWHAGTMKRYTCTVCGKSFNHGLQVHMRTHSGVKPYSCTECDMAFTVRSTLNKHIKNKHKKTSQFEKQL